MSVSVVLLQIISYQELCMLLGVTEHILQGSDIHVKFRNDDELIVSPRRKRRKGSRNGPVLAASTPRVLRNRSMEQNISRPQLNESMLSGYDGDREDDLDDSLISLDGMIVLHLSCLCTFVHVNLIGAENHVASDTT